MTAVYVRNGALRRVAEVDGRLELDCRVRWSGLGEWKLTLPARHPAALLFTHTAGIIVDRGGPAPFLTGRVMELDSREELEGQHTLTVSGVTDEYVLRDRLALPPRTDTGYGAYHDQTGPAESVMRSVVSVNAGPAAEDGRRYPDLELERDEQRGRDVRARLRFVPLLAALQELGRAGGVGFRVVQVGTSRRVRFSEPRDRSRAVVFGFDRGTLKTLAARSTGPTGSYLYAGGKGELAARRILELEDTPVVARYGGPAEGRREVFLDERSAEDDAYLRQKLEEARVEHSPTSALTVDLTEGPDAVFGLPDAEGGFDLGDLVTVRDRQTGATFTDRVAEVRLTIGEDSVETLRPVVASEGATLSGLNIVSTLRRLNGRVTRLETGA